MHLNIKLETTFQMLHTVYICTTAYGKYLGTLSLPCTLVNDQARGRSARAFESIIR